MASNYSKDSNKITFDYFNPETGTWERKKQSFGDIRINSDGNKNTNSFNSDKNMFLDTGDRDDSIRVNLKYNKHVTVVLGTGDDILGYKNATPTNEYESSLKKVHFFGESGNDTIRPTDNTEKSLKNPVYADGGTGNDYIEGYQAKDILLGMDGDDTINGEGNDDYISGGDGNDILDGNGDKDTVDGGLGDDVIDGGPGTDLLIGGEGNDLLISGSLYQDANDVLTGGAGTDTFFLGQTDQGIASSGTDWGSIALSAVEGVNSLAFAAASTPQAKVAKHIVPTILKFVDVIKNQNGSKVDAPHKAAYATITDFNPLEDVVIIPLADNGNTDVFISTDSNTENILSFKYDTNSTDIFATLEFADPENILGSGYTHLDNKILESFQNQLKNNALIIDSSGAALNQYDKIPLNEFSSEVQAQLQNLGNRFMIVGAYSGVTSQGTNNADYLEGNNYDDVLAGYSLYLDGGTYIDPDASGVDQLRGYGGDDKFYGGDGNDRILGGDGSDTSSYEDSSDGIVVDLSNIATDDNGTHILVEDDGFGDNDKLESIENIVGSDYDDIIKGDGNNNILIGGEGEDTLAGGGNLQAFGDAFTALDNNFTIQDYSWNTFDEYPRHLADVNGDGQADIVGFGKYEVAVALGQSDGKFTNAFTALDNSFTIKDGGWNTFDEYPRHLADVNGDGRADIVGFGKYEVAVALGQSDGTFANGFRALNNSFTITDGGWNTFDEYPRHLADVNGDGRADIVGFGNYEVKVALGQSDGTFANGFSALKPNFSVRDGWSDFDKYPRQLGDVDGDGRADIVGFDDGDVKVALGQSDGTFGEVQIVLDNNFTIQDYSWNSFDEYPRHLADVDGDGRDDIVGFGQYNVYVALSEHDGTVSDTLTGGADADTFILDNNNGSPQITDFSATDGDMIEIDQSVYGIDSLSDISFNAATGILSTDSITLALLEDPAGFDLATDVSLF
ncbi:MAG: hypothetical protein WBA77_17355 [Microcoleaceae cyanobacterium]